MSSNIQHPIHIPCIYRDLKGKPFINFVRIMLAVFYLRPKNLSLISWILQLYRDFNKGATFTDCIVACMYSTLYSINTMSHVRSLYAPSQTDFASNSSGGTMSSRSKSHSLRVCCFCGLSEDNELEFGKFYRHGNIVTHYYCLLLSSNMEQKGTDDQGILGFLKVDIQKEVRRGKRLVCSYCRKNGATLGCCNVKCKRIFHYPCGLRAGTLNQFFGEFRSFCINHRPKQKLDIQVKNEMAKPNEVVCYICYDNVEPSDVMSTIWAPCCKKNAWFHRKCVQQLAVSAGYFFKCPLCNDKKSFQTAMLEFGIFIPSQDASWELVPNAFQELLYRHDQCDSPICLCPKGRKYTSFNAKWELALCRTCGSQGIHMACGQLKWGNPIWECKECTSILGKSNGTTNVNISTLQNDSDSEASDISVGKDSPIPFASTTPVLSSTPHASAIKLRPGPRTFKLKQLKAAKEMLSMRLSNSSNSQATQNMVETLRLSHVGESTSDNGASLIKSHSLLSNLISRDCEEYPRPVPEHSKSLLTPSNNNFFAFDSDDDVEITSESLSNSTLDSANGSRSQSIIEDGKKNSSSLTVSKFLGRHNFKKTGDNSSMTSNLKVTKTARLNESSSQDVEKPSVLEEIINLDQKDDECDRTDSLSNIQITNVISLPPENFGIMPSVNDAEGADDIECLTLQNTNDSLNHSRLSRSLPQNDSSDTRLKRKFDKATLNATSSLVDKSKKMRRNLIAHELGQKSSFTFVDVKNTANSIMSLDNISAPTFNKTDEKIDNNTKENNASANVSNSQSKDNSYIEIDDDWVTSKSTAFVRTYCAKPSAKGAALKYKQKDNSNGTVACSTSDINESNKIHGNMKTEEVARNCDGDAGTSPAARSGKSNLANDTGESNKPDRSHSRSNRSHTTGQRRSQNDNEKATISTSTVSNNLSNSVFHQKEKENGNECHHPRLTSEYVHLRDLKFRVCNSNNLQMILYNKYLVNINMESATTTPKRNTRFNASTRRAVQQKPFKAQNETVSNCKCEDKYSLLVTVQSDNYRDDTKENLDPVTPISCKSVADNLPTNTALIANNLTVSASSNNQSDGDNPTKSVYNGTKVIADNKWCHGEDANLISNTESIFDAEEPLNASPYANCGDKHFRSINNVKRTIQSLSSDLVASSISATKLYQLDSRLHDHANGKIESRSRSASRTPFKVSIDLEKIEDFMGDNPDLFHKHKSQNCEQSLEDARLLKGRSDVAERISLPSRPATNSATDELKSFGDLTLSLPRNKTKFRSHANETSENIGDLIGAGDLVQETRSINNSLSHNPTCDLKRTSSRFEKQCIFNR
ncbi:uncharacterized protein LOC143366255 [Andrena cerasifolii]|uniref:uncharacterized protein LOC143366255 n=1 Tax=Andrena cerasifolii TaxID=2819439 RepID=UPI00403765C5